MIELTSGEQRALTATCDALHAIKNIDEDHLQYNEEELVNAIHVLQAFVKQHYCHRLNSKDWSNWYGNQT